MNQTEVSRSYTTKQEQAYQFSLKGNCKMKRLNGNWSCSWPQARLLFSYQHGMKIDLVLQWKALIQYPLHQECHCRYSPKRFCPLHRILTHLWEQLRKGELQYAFEVCNLSIKKVCNLAIYAKKKNHFANLQCHQVLWHKHREVLLCLRPDSLQHVQSNLVFHL
jgi:hypothetical protein